MTIPYITSYLQGHSIQSETSTHTQSSVFYVDARNEGKDTA